MALAHWRPCGSFSVLPSCCEWQSSDVRYWHLADCLSRIRRVSAIGSKADIPHDGFLAESQAASAVQPSRPVFAVSVASVSSSALCRPSHPALSTPINVFFADHIENRSLIGEKASKFCDDEGLEVGCWTEDRRRCLNSCQLLTRSNAEAKADRLDGTPQRQLVTQSGPMRFP